MANGEFGGGTGSSNDPYIVEDYLDLQEVANNLDAHFIQSEDIDLSEITNWEPIGDSDDPFTGNYNADGHVITGLVVNRPEQDNVGLFGVVYQGIIHKLGVIDASVVGGSHVGVLIGRMSSEYPTSAQITQCWVSGSVSGDTAVGGFVGTNAGWVEDSFSRASVDGNKAVGGFVGDNMGFVYRSYSTGLVIGNSDTGGFAGMDIEIPAPNWVTRDRAWFGFDAVSGGQDLRVYGDKDTGYVVTYYNSEYTGYYNESTGEWETTTNMYWGIARPNILFAKDGVILAEIVGYANLFASVDGGATWVITAFMQGAASGFVIIGAAWEINAGSGCCYWWAAANPVYTTTDNNILERTEWFKMEPVPPWASRENTTHNGYFYIIEGDYSIWKAHGSTPTSWTKILDFDTEIGDGFIAGLKSVGGKLFTTVSDYSGEDPIRTLCVITDDDRLVKSNLWQVSGLGVASIIPTAERIFYIEEWGKFIAFTRNHTFASVDGIVWEKRPHGGYPATGSFSIHIPGDGFYLSNSHPDTPTQTTGAVYHGVFDVTAGGYGNVVDCYYDSETSGQSDEDKGTGIPTAQLKEAANLENWDFEEVWLITTAINDGYPNLQWYEPEIELIWVPSDLTELEVEWLQVDGLAEIRDNAEVVTAMYSVVTEEGAVGGYFDHLEFLRNLVNDMLTGNNVVYMPMHPIVGDIEIPVFGAVTEVEMVAAHVVPKETITGDSNDYCQLELVNKETGLTMSTLTFVEGAVAPAYKVTSFGPMNVNGEVSLYEGVSLKVTNYGSGLQLPEFTLILEWNLR